MNEKTSKNKKLKIDFKNKGRLNLVSLSKIIANAIKYKDEDLTVRIERSVEKILNPYKNSDWDYNKIGIDVNKQFFLTRLKQHINNSGVGLMKGFDYSTQFLIITNHKKEELCKLLFLHFNNENKFQIYLLAKEVDNDFVKIVLQEEYRTTHKKLLLDFNEVVKNFDKIIDPIYFDFNPLTYEEREKVKETAELSVAINKILLKCALNPVLFIGEFEAAEENEFLDKFHLSLSNKEEGSKNEVSLGDLLQELKEQFYLENYSVGMFELFYLIKNGKTTYGKKLNAQIKMLESNEIQKRVTTEIKRDDCLLMAQKTEKLIKELTQNTDTKDFLMFELLLVLQSFNCIDIEV